jgi:hypothetical protein
MLDEATSAASGTSAAPIEANAAPVEAARVAQSEANLNPSPAPGKMNRAITLGGKPPGGGKGRRMFPGRLVTF